MSPTRGVYVLYSVVHACVYPKRNRIREDYLTDQLHVIVLG